MLVAPDIAILTREQQHRGTMEVVSDDYQVVRSTTITRHAPRVVSIPIPCALSVIVIGGEHITICISPAVEPIVIGSRHAI